MIQITADPNVIQTNQVEKNKLFKCEIQSFKFISC